MQRLSIIWNTIRIATGFSNKTYFGIDIPAENGLKKKGHILQNPTEDQVYSVHDNTLRKTRIENWFIEENGYKNNWSKRPLNIIDSLVITASNCDPASSAKIYKKDTSPDNCVTKGTPLPGIGTHIYINASGLSEKVSAFEDLIIHTSNNNTNSISIMIQYLIDGNSSSPTKKVMRGLERTLALLCLMFKLNPLTAIKTQKSCRFKWLPFGKGRNIEKYAPGMLFDLSNLRKEICITMQRKLFYAGLYDGVVDGKYSRKLRKAINEFSSNAISRSITTTKCINLDNYNDSENDI